MVRFLSLICLHGRRQFCVVERAVWSAYPLYYVCMVIGGFVGLGEQCGPFSPSIVSQWS